MDVQHRKGLLLIGSDGRKSGKTELACAILRHFTPAHVITAVKITTIHAGGCCPKGGNGCGVCDEVGDSYRILVEKSSSGAKDTVRLRTAGADTVFWVQSRYSALRDARDALLSFIPQDRLWLCESNSIRLFLEPDIFLLVRKVGRNTIKPSAQKVVGYADRIIYSSGADFDPHILAIKNGEWTFVDPNVVLNR